VARLAWPIADEKIRLDAVVTDGRLVPNRVVSARNRGIAAALAGRPVGEVLALLRRLFPLCGIAHTIAAVTAIETAFGLVPSRAQRAFRELMLVTEHANSVAWRLLMDWPPLLGGAGDTRTYAAFLRASAPITADADRLQQIGGGALRLPRAETARAARSLAAMLTALFPEGADPTLSFDGLEVALRSGESVPARLLARARADLPAHYGRHDWPLFAAAHADWFAHRLADTPGFSDAPNLDGSPAEVGPLAALRHPLVGEALAHWGSGLATRLLAAALDASVVAARLRACDRVLDDDASDVDTTGDGRGAGVVETARGPLAYWLEVEGGRVRTLRSVAPTEWNFHPAGPFRAALDSAPAIADPVAGARLLAASFDPCVPFDIAIAPSQGASNEDALHA
jgi:uptake hydrogenase large subunit